MDDVLYLNVIKYKLDALKSERDTWINEQGVVFDDVTGDNAHQRVRARRRCGRL